jgi:hypothetical protein
VTGVALAARLDRLAYRDRRQSGGRDKLSPFQLPIKVTTAAGIEPTRPAHWS